MAAKNSKAIELIDIPLTLEQGDGVDLDASRATKLKTNSLKRFFRTAKSGLQSSKSADSTDSADNSDSKTRSINLRFGSFCRNDRDASPTAPHVDDMEASTSNLEHSNLKTDPSTESRLSLQERLSHYWTHVFKKSTKKSPSNKDQVEDVRVEGGSADPNEISQNPIETL